MLEKKIGVAISDELGITAQGIEVIECKNHGKDIDRICRAYFRLQGR